MRYYAKLWAPDLPLIRWRKKWRKLRDKYNIIIVSQKTFFLTWDFKNTPKEVFQCLQKNITGHPGKKKEKKQCT